MDQITLYSIGHSNAPTERLVAPLRRYAIATLCDVRSTPYSRYNPQFNREALAASLRPTGIVYRYLGDALGGLPDATANRTAQTFEQGIEQLLALGALAPTAFMCGEADYRSCHRHKLITPALIERGAVVEHILADGSLERGWIEPRQMQMF
jgi:uncharacterized protein (DUF488 family)